MSVPGILADHLDRRGEPFWNVAVNPPLLPAAASTCALVQDQSVGRKHHTRSLRPPGRPTAPLDNTSPATWVVALAGRSPVVGTGTFGVPSAGFDVLAVVPSERPRLADGRDHHRSRNWRGRPPTPGLYKRRRTSPGEAGGGRWP